MSIFLLLMPFSVVKAQKTITFYQQETVCMTPQGPIRQSAGTGLTVNVTWMENGNIKLSDGTIWKDEGMASSGGEKYSYLGTSSTIIMPNTRYTDLIMSRDCSTMQVSYIFGTPGFTQKMTTYYTTLDFTPQQTPSPKMEITPIQSYPGNVMPTMPPMPVYPTYPTPTYPTYPVYPIYY